MHTKLKMYAAHVGIRCEYCTPRCPNAAFRTLALGVKDGR